MSRADTFRSTIVTKHGVLVGQALLDRLRAHRAKLHRAVRVTVAAALAYELATRLDLPQGFWAVITAVIVMQSSVGGTLAASIDRMVGTVGGAVVGAAVAVVGSWTKMPEVLGLAAAIIPLSIAASVYQSMRVAPVTAAIMLLASPSNVDPVVSAADRVFEIAVGSIVGLAVAIFVFPARAHGLLADKAARTLALLAEVLRNTLARFFGSRDDAALTRLHQRIRASLAEAETAGVEAERERSSGLTGDPDGPIALREASYNSPRASRTDPLSNHCDTVRRRSLSAVARPCSICPRSHELAASGCRRRWVLDLERGRLQALRSW